MEKTAGEDVLIRRARVSEASPLTALALRSKASWGYSSDFMTAFAPELVIPEDYLRTAPVLVAENGAGLSGFAGLSRPGEPPELVYLFVDPRCFGTGCGKRLWEESVRVAKGLGWDSFLIVADPNAEPFYLKMGAVKTGERTSRYYTDSRLPELRFTFGS